VARSCLPGGCFTATSVPLSSHGSSSRALSRGISETARQARRWLLGMTPMRRWAGDR